MKINAICIKGFKGYKDEVIYNFSDFTVIEGGNTKGKTSIGEAILWALYGANLEGNEKADTILMNNESETMYVVIDFSINSVEYRLTRKRSKSLSLKLNGEKISPKELNELLPNKDLFLSVFNTEVFLSLTPAKARQALLKMLPKVNHLDVLQANNAWDKLSIIEYYPNVNDGIIEITSKIKSKYELKNIKHGESAMIREFMMDNSFNSENIIEFTKEDESRINEIRSIINNTEKTTPELIDTSEIKNNIKDLENLITLENMKKYDNSQSSNVQQMEIEVATMRGQYKIYKSNYESFLKLDAICQTCGQEISSEHKENEVSKLTMELDSLEKEIRQYQMTIDMIKSIENENKETFEIEKIKSINQLSYQLENLKNELVLIDEGNKYTGEALKASIYESIANYKVELDILLKKQSKYISKNAEFELKKENLDKYKQKSELIVKQVNAINEELKELEMNLQFLKEYNSMYVNYLGDILTGWLNNVTIDLFKVTQSTGELKDTFDIKYEGRNFNLLSNSERARVAIELANMFNKSLGIQVPVFVDNAECITDIPELDTQMIIAKVIDGEIIIKENKKINHNQKTDSELINYECAEQVSFI